MKREKDNCPSQAAKGKGTAAVCRVAGKKEEGMGSAHMSEEE